jgi:hypothetical protein
MAEQNGYLQVFVRTAGGSLPVEGARVRVESATLLRELVTDKSGRTARIPLPAPAASDSLSAGVRNPFALYRVRVEKEGFYPQLTENVPVFAGVGSLQPITLVGLAEYGSGALVPDGTDTVPVDPQTLNRP